MIVIGKQIGKKFFYRQFKDTNDVLSFYKVIFGINCPLDADYASKRLSRYFDISGFDYYDRHKEENVCKDETTIILGMK